MLEDFLHFLWQFQRFDRKNLQTTDNQDIQVLKLGYWNTNAGPDFTEARLVIGGVEWAGNVEIHLKSSDWKTHEHHTNAAYENVILHVVWQHDTEIFRSDGSLIPTVVLEGRTDVSLQRKYKQLLDNQEEIACQSQFRSVDEVAKIALLDKALMQRLEQKAQVVHELYAQNRQDWEETAYQLLAQNFGFKVNAEAFLRLSQNLPLKTLQKHRNNPLQIETLVFGVAGFLTDVENPDEYTQTLIKEFAFLSAKYQLSTKTLGKHEWKFLRLRPANFPTVRLAQFAQLIVQQASLFSLFIDAHSVENLAKMLKIKQSSYWQKHYLLGKPTDKGMEQMGRTSVENLFINTLVPLLVAYSQVQDQPVFLERAIQILEQLPPEKNHITDLWQGLGLRVKTAFDSQALVEQYRHFCQPKQCLRCSVGVALLK